MSVISLCHLGYEVLPVICRPISRRVSFPVRSPSRHRLGPLHMSLKAKLGSQKLFPRAPRTTFNGFAPGIQLVAKMRPQSRPVRACPGTNAPDGPPTIDAMPLEIHTQPDPDHFCETCGGPSELISQTITSWDGNETMAREVSPWTPRCADPWCQSRRPRHRRRATRTSASTKPVGRYR
jgi:hypothetical protein